MSSGAYIFAPKGLRLNRYEKWFFRDADPWGFILFARNIDDPEQVRALTSELRETVGWHAPILIDQEGGRVQRMRAPHWREYLPALDQMRQAREPMKAQLLRNRLIAEELRAVGIDVNCAPLADVLEENTHLVLANRLYGDDVDTVVQAARVCAEAFKMQGVLPVLKHIPGYGRAHVDSHTDLPRVDATRSVLTRRDFKTFEALKDIAMGMTAHIVYEAIDPQNPATTSPTVIRLIRKEIGFDGLLMTDDISMGALSGTIKDRAEAAMTAGCDIILHCNGVTKEMIQVAAGAGPMRVNGMVRADVALMARQDPSPIDISAAAAELESLLA
ncbi:beta-N-acetylhexosaminidase [Cognatiyoonia sediminum]|uniref:beta-N-acetylhexosaminidase n=1 Tax=Cognatiyoonia sediminum TaxID=1508389 RepID=A0A1M5LWK9_9RHOB|nr:glycoside hydrolase family 3 N-terminal domain-containing protein [Cognatiyoonia sediminum]SHG68753.1 beta-N-acetylhexosaminidase [Cognatiyoonia sediminum]